MTLPWTLALLALGLVLCALSRWYETRPRGLGEVSLFPTTLVLGIGVLLTVQLAAVWSLVLSRTLAGVWHGELFQAPCLGGPGSPAVGVLSEQAS